MTSPAPATTDALAARFAPGEDATPLLRSVVSALLGVLVALAIDALVPNGATWATLGMSLVGCSSSAMGLAAICALAILASLTFTYGQVRRFLPGAPMAAGLVWSLACWLLGAPLLLPRADAIGATADAPAALVAALMVVSETGAGVALYGCLLGLLNPRPEQPGDAGAL